MTAQELEALLAEVTPGAWHIDPDDRFEVLAEDGAADPWCIAGAHRSVGHIEGDNQSAANARLIAMAPDLARKVLAAEKLVESLEIISDVADECDDYHYDDGNQAPIDVGTCRAIRAALAAWAAAQ